MKKRALITGISGFIGKNLAIKLIKNGWIIHGIIRDKTDRKSISDIENLCTLHTHNGSTEDMIRIHSENDFDLVFHLSSLYLASHKSNQISDLIKSNIEFSTQLLEGMSKGNCRKIINIGSYSQHDKDETFTPFNLYSSTKEAFQAILYFYHLANNLSCITLKLFDTYGHGDTRNKLVNLLINSIKLETSILLSPGEQILDLSSVNDIVNHLEQAAIFLCEKEYPIWKIFLISGERMTVKELVHRLEKIIGKKFKGNFGGRPYREREIMNPIKENRLLPWHKEIQTTNFDQEIKELI